MLSLASCTCEVLRIPTTSRNSILLVKKLSIVTLLGFLKLHHNVCTKTVNSGLKSTDAMLLAKQCFCEIKKYIRFDLRSTRSERIKEDKFCMMSFVLNRFAENSQKSFAPAESLTVDEQLFPTKAKCRFTQYVLNKPDKFGIKFWILADLETKYCLNIIPYLEKDETRVDSLGTHVVMQLMEPYITWLQRNNGQLFHQHNAC